MLHYYCPFFEMLRPILKFFMEHPGITFMEFYYGITFTNIVIYHLQLGVRSAASRIKMSECLTNTDEETKIDCTVYKPSIENYGI